MMPSISNAAVVLRRGYCAKRRSRRIYCNVGAKRPRAELIQLLAEHRQALAASCASYDSGNEWEAARLATTIFTLVHDGGSITSLLSQLGLRASLRFVSSGRDVSDKYTVLSTTPLVIFETNMGRGARCIPRLDRPHSGGLLNLQFSTWWADEIIYKERRHGVELTLEAFGFCSSSPRWRGACWHAD